MNKSDWSALADNVKKQVQWNTIRDNPQAAMDRATELALKFPIKGYVDLSYYLYKANPKLKFNHKLMLVAAARVGHNAFVKALLDNYEIPDMEIGWAMRQTLKRREFETFSLFVPYVNSKRFNYILSQERFWPALVYLDNIEQFEIENPQAFVNAFVLIPWALDKLLMIPKYRKIFMEHPYLGSFEGPRSLDQYYYTCISDDLPVALQYYISTGEFRQFESDREPWLYAAYMGFDDILSVLSSNLS